MEERKNKIVTNRWNRKEYLVVGETGKEVTLQRDDGSLLVIEKGELNFNYQEKK